MLAVTQLKRFALAVESAVKAAFVGASSVKAPLTLTLEKVDARPADVTTLTSVLRPADTATSTSEVTFASMTVSTRCTHPFVQLMSGVVTAA